MLNLMMKSKNTTKSTAGQRPAVASNTNKMKKKNESKKGMKTLNWSSTIETGIYAGEMVCDCLKHNGKKAIFELLKHYDFCEEIMRVFHFHSVGVHKEDEKPSAKVTTQCTTSTMDKYEMPITSTITTEPVFEDTSEDALDYADSLDAEFSEWISNRSDDHDNVLYDPEDEVLYPYLGWKSNSMCINY